MEVGRRMTRVNVSIDVSAIPAALTGAGRYVVELVNALDRRDDVDVTLVARTDDVARWPTGPRLLPAAPRSRPARLVWEQLRLPALLRGSGVEVHHGPHYTMPERSPVPAVVTIHDLTFFDHPEWHERRKVPVFRRAITRAAAKAGALICVSETTAARFRERFPRSAPIFVAPHGVDHRRFTALAPDRDGDAATLARLGVGPPYVAFVGTIEPRKDVATLVGAFDRIAASNRDLTLVLAGGQGWGDPGVDAAIARARHGERVVRLGYVDLSGVPALLRGATAVAYPSRDEGFGLPVLEAMACGAPVVSTAHTVMAEVAGDGALLVPAGDVDALAGAIETIIAGGPLVQELRRQAVLRAAQFTWDASASRHVDAYRSVG
jgi:glycosyltransferase involved in cell wall biosynthesis